MTKQWVRSPFLAAINSGDSVSHSHSQLGEEASVIQKKKKKRQVKVANKRHLLLSKMICLNCKQLKTNILVSKFCHDDQDQRIFKCTFCHYSVVFAFWLHLVLKFIRRFIFR